MKKPSLRKLRVKLPEFPSISRWIPEWASSLKLSREAKAIFAGFILLILILTLVLAGLDLYKNLGEKQRIEAKQQELVREIEFWKAVANKHKDYRDAYFQLAVLEYQLGESEKASFYLQKTFSLDPNFQEGRKLEKILK